jgi:hypothetical protein
MAAKSESAGARSGAELSNRLLDKWRPGALCKQTLHDWPKGPQAVALSLGSGEPLLGDLAQRPELRILVHQHGAL